VTLFDRLLGRNNGNGHGRARLALSAKREELLRAKSGVTLTGDVGWSPVSPLFTLGGDVEVPDANNLIALNRKCSIISSAVAEIATGLAQAPLQLGVATEEDFDVVENDPRLELFYAVPGLPYGQLLALWATRLSLTGAAFSLRGKYAELGLDAELTPLPTHLVRQHSKGPTITGYEIVRREGEPVKVAPEEMLKLAYTDPASFCGWSSPLAAALTEWAIDQQRAKLTHEILKNRDIPGGFLGFTKDSPVTNLSKPQRQQLTEAMDDQCGAEAGRRGRLLFLPGGLQYTRGQEVSDIDLSFIASMSETRICAVLGVPPILLGLRAGLERSTFANYGEARSSFYREKLVPLWKFVADSLTQQLLEPDDGLEYRFDLRGIPELQEDVDARATRAALLFEKGIAKLDEARDMVGLAPVGGEDGEAFKAPPPSPFAAPAPGDQRPGDTDIPDGEKRLQGKSAARRQGEPSELEKVLLAEFREQQADILRAVGDGEPPPLSPPAAWQKRLADAARPVIFDAALDKARLTLRQVKGKTGRCDVHGKAALGSVEGSLEMIRPEVLALLEEQLQDFCSKVNKTTMKRLAEQVNVVTEAARVSNTLPDLAKAVKSVFEAFPEYRAWRIAVTEMNRASNASHVWASAATGEVKGYEVSVRADACPICQYLTADGKTTGIPVQGYVPVGTAVKEAGLVGGRVPPFHVNCLCALIPIFNDDPVPQFPDPPAGAMHEPRPAVWGD
jgi:HK97 family phage portal protein